MSYCLATESRTTGPGPFKPTYTPQGVARVLGWSVDYAWRYLKAMEYDGHAKSTGNGGYVLTKRGQLELISVLYDMLKQSDLLIDPILGIDPQNRYPVAGCFGHHHEQVSCFDARVPSIFSNRNLAYEALERLEKAGKVKKIKMRKGRYQTRD